MQIDCIVVDAEQITLKP